MGEVYLASPKRISKKLQTNIAYLTGENQPNIEGKSTKPTPGSKSQFDQYRAHRATVGGSLQSYDEHGTGRNSVSSANEQLTPSQASH